MQDGDNRVAFGFDNKDHAIHALSIGRGNPVSQSSEPSPTDHE
jgi:hypothetical protein